MHGTGEGEAVLCYHDGAFQVVRPGQFVRCAITRRPIPLEDLRYWSVARQEAYGDGDAVLEAWRRHSRV